MILEELSFKKDSEDALNLQEDIEKLKQEKDSEITILTDQNNQHKSKISQLSNESIELRRKQEKNVELLK